MTQKIYGGLRGRAVSEAEFRRLWESDLTKAEIGAILGISATAVGYRARCRGLPARTDGPPPAITDESAFRQMCLAGVLQQDIAGFFGVSARTVRAQAKRLGLPSRRLDRWQSISLAEFRHKLALSALSREAAQTSAALAAREMVDGKSGNPSGKRAT